MTWIAIVSAVVAVIAALVSYRASRRRAGPAAFRTRAGAIELP